MQTKKLLLSFKKKRSSKKVIQKDHTSITLLIPLIKMKLIFNSKIGIVGWPNYAHPPFILRRTAIEENHTIDHIFNLENMEFNDQLNLHFEKSISGWAFMNSFNFYCFWSSSDVGSPCCFCLISNIIFSTVERVSPSKSESFEGSGLIFWVLI